jgi:predicted TIM-barrel fold metal-dependent hydrolase
MSVKDLCANDRKVFIDVHCHVFNGSDLPVEGFIEKVKLNADEIAWRNIGKPGVDLLCEWLKSAPDGEKETKLLRKKLGLADADNEDGEVSDNQFDLELRDLIDKRKNSKDDDERELYSSLAAEAGIEPLNAAHVKGFLGRFWGSVKKMTKKLFKWNSVKKVAKWLLNAPGEIGRLFRWGRLLKKYRYEIVEKIVKMYGRDNGCVDLFTPSLVDFEFWVKERPRTSQPHQVEVMSYISRLYPGVIHPFFGYDPWRESESPDTADGSLRMLQNAVLSQGFIGAKLYPPMGFSAAHNSSHDFSGVTNEPSEEFGTKLDTALDALFDWCSRKENDVPIMAHCANSNYLRKDYGLRAHPDYWGYALDKFGDLRVNLGHFGGVKKLDTSDEKKEKMEWLWKIGSLMQEHSGVYADLGHFSGILDRDKRKEMFDLLEHFFGKYDEAPKRVMYATDWHMLEKVDNREDYFEQFSEEYFKRFGKEMTNDFLGGNAARFLGLYPDDMTRERLEAFYEDRQIALPSWMGKLS